MWNNKTKENWNVHKVRIQREKSLRTIIRCLKMRKKNLNHGTRWNENQAIIIRKKKMHIYVIIRSLHKRKNSLDVEKIAMMSCDFFWTSGDKRTRHSRGVGMTRMKSWFPFRLDYVMRINTKVNSRCCLLKCAFDFSTPVVTSRSWLLPLESRADYEGWKRREESKRSKGTKRVNRREGERERERSRRSSRRSI